MEYNYDYTLESAPSDPASAIAGAVILGSLLFFFFIMIIAIYAVSAFLLGRIFKKAGVPQWAAWVPVYNTWKLLELGGQQGFWAVLGLIPFVNILTAIFTYIAMHHIGKKLGKDDWFVLLAIFLPIVWMLWLAFDDSKWQTGKAVKTQTATGAKRPARSKKTSADEPPKT